MKDAAPRLKGAALRKLLWLIGSVRLLLDSSRPRLAQVRKTSSKAPPQFAQAETLVKYFRFQVVVVVVVVMRWFVTRGGQ